MALTSCGDRRADKAYLRDDYAKAARELEGLANLGEPRAQYNLAVLYDKGLGVPQNDAEALRWYMRAAEHGDARAQFNLGLMYMNGQGIEPNLIEAYYWVSLSTAQGNANAPSALDYLADKMTHEQIHIAQKLVREKLTERLRPFAQ
ncbi:MAG: tetratricopeptide repeat protein [Nitrospiraceae bacterium]